MPSFFYLLFGQRKEEEWMSDRIFDLVLALIPVIGAVVTYFVVPYLKAAVGNAKLEQYREWAGLAVKCAEMVWRETGHGGDKRDYVAGFLNRMFNSKKEMLSEEQIQVLIEAAVQELQRETDSRLENGRKVPDDGK